MAVGSRGTTYHLTNAKKHPRGQLLEKACRQHAQKIFIDSAGVDVQQRKHIGYIVAGEWFTIYEVHAWEQVAD